MGESIQPAPMELTEETASGGGRSPQSSESSELTESVSEADGAVREQLNQDPLVVTDLAVPAQCPDSACAAEIPAVFHGDESDESLCALLERRTRTLLSQGT